MAQSKYGLLSPSQLGKSLSVSDVMAARIAIGLLASDERRSTMWKIDKGTQNLHRVDHHHRTAEA